MDDGVKEAGQEVEVEQESMSEEDSYRAEILAAQGFEDGSDSDAESDASEGGEDQPVKDEEDIGEPEEEKEGSGEEKGEIDSDGKEHEEKVSEKAPPDGFVSQKALHAERHYRQSVQEENARLKAEVERLNNEISDVKSKALVSLETGFRPLSDEELTKLAYDDPDAVPTYLENKKRYEEALSGLSEKQSVPQESEEYRRAVDFAYTSLSAQIPGILDQGSEAQSVFYSNFEKVGLDDAFSPLLDPSTALVTRDGKTIPLGENAISIINLINKAGSYDPESERSRIREEVTKELVAKFKKQSKPSGSLADINSVDREGFNVPEPTSAQKARFTDDQWDRYTAGADWRIK